MSPVLLGVGGGRSGAGKTTVICKILKNLPGWGAIKYTKTSLYGSITDDIEVISERGKDTRRFLDSGAGKVLWVRAPFHELAAILPVAVEMFSGFEGVVIEGNSAIEILRPDIVIFVSAAGGKIKGGAERILGMADIVVFDGDPPAGTPGRAKYFRMNEAAKIPEFISPIIKKLSSQ